MSKKRALAVMFAFAIFGTIAIGQEMPKPRLEFVRVDDVTENGRSFRVYTVEIANRADFSDELFAASPGLQPCGKNADSSRTWINIYADGRRLNGWCAIRSNSELSSLKFNVPADMIQPTKLYVDLVDRRDGKLVKSNKVHVLQN
jgi:hypothetical protein